MQVAGCGRLGLLIVHRLQTTAGFLGPANCTERNGFVVVRSMNDGVVRASRVRVETAACETASILQR